MSERTVSTLVAVVLASSSLLAQSAPAPTAELPYIHGRVTDESGEKPVAGATVTPYPAFRSEGTTTNEQGEFAALGKPSFVKDHRTNNLPYDLVAYFTITAPGHARTLVDPCADAPWAAPIRMRDSATLRGYVENLPSGHGHDIVAIADWKDLCWPPRSGLTRTDQRWIDFVDSQSRFEIQDLPAGVPLSLRFDAGERNGDGSKVVEDFVLAPREVREIVVNAQVDLPLPHVVPPTGEWIEVSPSASVPEGTTSNLFTFELLENWRHDFHRNMGGRAHVHGSRACNDLEALPGAHTLIAFDARGHIGLERFDIQARAARVVPHATMAPGALLRIAFDGPEERARITLSSRGIEFRARELPRGAVWYELAPAGKVSIRVTSTVADPRSIEVDARAGQIERIRL